MKNLAGGTAVVTGAGNGIGRGTALALAHAGMHVAVADIDGDAAHAVAEEVRQCGVRAISQQTDVTDLAAVELLAERAYSELGPVRVLHNNAGVGLIDTLDRTTPADWQWVFSVNIFGVMNGLHTFLPRMLADTDEKHIVNTGSMSGHYSSAILGVYSASKFAVIALSETLRDEMAGKHIGVSVLCPGLVNTRIVGRSRRARPSGIPTSPPDMPVTEGEWEGNRVVEPEDVGRQIVRAIEENEFWIMTHPEQKPRVKARFDEIVDAMDRAAARARSV